ncbi:ABC transporter permease [Georgenia sp. AZ-5]|uniref:ABC transporter permease n=1 Tax=Georgenia sp. AZ-5 TaxID=3367526 RepID=UPI0037551F75
MSALHGPGAVGKASKLVARPSTDAATITSAAVGRAPRRLAPVRVLLGLLVPAALLAGWQLASAAGWLDPTTLPAPITVLSAAGDLLERGQLGVHVAISTQRVLLGFLSGAAAGLAAGAVIGLSRWAEALFAPTIGAFRAVPSLAWVPLLLLWIGIGENSKVTLIAIGAFFPVFTTVSMALRHVDRHLVEAGRAFGLRGARLFTTVQLPAVVPSVVSGLRLALAQSWLFLVAAELLASSMGLGFLLTDSQYNGRVDRMLLAIVLLAVLGKLTDAVLGLFERWAIKRWA